MVAEGVDVGWRSDNWHCFRAIYYRHIFQKIYLISHFVKLFTLKAQQFFCTNLLHLSNFVVHLYKIIICICTTQNTSYLLQLSKNKGEANITRCLTRRDKAI